MARDIIIRVQHTALYIPGIYLQRKQHACRICTLSANRKEKGPTTHCCIVLEAMHAGLTCVPLPEPGPPRTKTTSFGSILPPGVSFFRQPVERSLLLTWCVLIQQLSKKQPLQRKRCCVATWHRQPATRTIYQVPGTRYQSADRTTPKPELQAIECTVEYQVTTDRWALIEHSTPCY